MLVRRLLRVGALTSRSSRYSYRSWEFEQMESYDLFDTSGASIVYHIYNNNIIKAGSIVSGVTAWCTDKIRNFVDSFFYPHHIHPKLFISFDTVCTWIDMHTHLVKLLSIGVLYTSINTIKGLRSIIHDSYSNNLELCSVLRFTRECNIISLHCLRTLTCALHFGFFSICLDSARLCSNLVFLCSNLNLVYPYLFIELGSFMSLIMVVGLVYTSKALRIHKCLGFLYLYVVCDNLSILCNQRFTSYLLDGFLFLSGNNVYLGPFFSFIGCIFSTFTKYGLLLKTTQLLGGGVSDYIGCNTYSVFSPYSFFLFECLALVFTFDQGYGTSYFFLNCDVWGYSCYSNIVLLLAHHKLVHNHFYDLIYPLCSFVHHSSIHVDYYGNYNIYSPINNQSFMLTLRSCIRLVRVVYSLDIGEFCAFYLQRWCFFVPLRVRKVTLLYAISLFCTCIIICNLYGAHWSNLGTTNYVYRSPFYDVASRYVLLSMCLKICNYVDLSTYFLTGTYCRVSKFMARHVCAVGTGFSFL